MPYGLPKMEARVTVPAGGWTLTVTDSGGTSPVTIAAGDYYLGELLTAIAAALNADATLAGTTYAAVLDDDATDATGRLTLSVTVVGNFSVTWTSTALRDELGYSGDLSGAASYQTTAAAKPLFLPDVPRTRMLVPDGHPGRLIVASSTVVSPTTGDSRFFSYGSYRMDNWEHAQLSGRKTYATYEAYANESFESFWTTYIANGAPIRYFPDRGDDGTSVPWRVVEASAFPAKEEIENVIGGLDSDGADLRHHIGPMAVIAYVET